MDSEIEQLVVRYGEGRRELIVDALEWLQRKEKQWELSQPMDRDRFVAFLIDSIGVHSRSLASFRL